MITVAALTSGLPTPSSRYRVRQYIPSLRMKGIKVTEFYSRIEKYSAPSHRVQRFLRLFRCNTPTYWHFLRKMNGLSRAMCSHFYTMTWLERILVPYCLTYELRLKHPLVFDVDDAIWLDEGRDGAEVIARHADSIIVGNSYLADWFSQYNQNVRIIPTAVNTDWYKPLTEQQHDEIFRIGWIGTSSNFKYLKLIEIPLKRFLIQFKNTKITIISDSYPDQLCVPHEKLEFIPWSATTDNQNMQRFSIGIMPLSDDEWTRGKCSYKMLLYMASAKPVIVSPVGMNMEILNEAQCGIYAKTHDEWFEALQYLYHCDEMAIKMGRRGMNLVKSKYSVSFNSRMLAQVFYSLC